MGRAENTQRALDGRDRGRLAYMGRRSTDLAGLKDVPAQPCRWHRVHRFVHGALDLAYPSFPDFQCPVGLEATAVPTAHDLRLDYRHALRSEGDCGARAGSTGRGFAGGFAATCSSGPHLLTQDHTCIICSRKVQPAKNWVRCHVWGSFASFHWLCFGEYVHADSEQQVENVVWKASSNRDPEQADR